MQNITRHIRRVTVLCNIKITSQKVAKIVSDYNAVNYEVIVKDV